jgi:hypothetical protein
MRRGVVAAALIAALSGFGFAANASAESISGTVTNKTTNKPSVGDDVVLLKLAQGMQEAGHAKTDAKGHFKLDFADPGTHLIRVTHDHASYFQAVTEGATTVDVTVYSSAEKVKGVVTEADVMRLQTDASGKALTVVENFFIKNDSAPPMTQFSDRPFDFYLPAGAVVDGSAALSPGGMPVQTAPVPLADSPNHFTFVFPIRPGETRFQVSFHVPYTGSFTFSPKASMTTDTVAVMMPKSMTFKAGSGAAFTPVTEETTAQTFVSRNVAPSQALPFTVSGSGELPRDEASAAGGSGGPQPGGGAAADAANAAGATAATDTRPGGGLGTPIDPTGDQDPWAKYKWWILGGLGLALAAGAGLMLKNGPPSATSGLPRKDFVVPAGSAAYAGGHVVSGGSVLSALKEELFTLESERLEGQVSDAEYAEQKAALDVLLKRALARSKPGAATSNVVAGTVATPDVEA